MPPRPGSIFAPYPWLPISSPTPAPRSALAAVFLKGVAVFGLFPFVALILVRRRRTACLDCWHCHRRLFHRRRRLFVARSPVDPALAAQKPHDRRGSDFRPCLCADCRRSTLAAAVRDLRDAGNGVLFAARLNSGGGNGALHQRPRRGHLAALLVFFLGTRDRTRALWPRVRAPGGHPRPALRGGIMVLVGLMCARYLGRPRPPGAGRRKTACPPRG